jgi:hypothetical protein
MTGTRVRLAVTAAALLVLAPAAAASTSTVAETAGACPVLRTAGHSWIVVAKGMTCGTATGAVRRLAARTASLGHGRTLRVTSPLSGYTCVLRNAVKPSGACVKGTAHTVIWLVAA